VQYSVSAAISAPQLRQYFFAVSTFGLLRDFARTATMASPANTATKSTGTAYCSMVRPGLLSVSLVVVVGEVAPGGEVVGLAVGVDGLEGVVVVCVGVGDGGLG